jgi:LPS sulfotransferase NodH
MIESFPARAYFLCADARTGSSLLAAALRLTERIGKPFEYFVETEIEAPWLRAELHVPDSLRFTSFRDWRDYIIKAGSEFNGVFGATVHWFKLSNAVETFRTEAPGGPTKPVDALRAFFPELRFIWLSRDNIVAQAVSHYVAISTGVWNRRTDYKPGDGRTDHLASYDFDAIDWQVKSALVAYEGWRDTLADARELTLPLSYEQLSDDLNGAVGKVFAHLGVAPGSKPAPPPPLRKQASQWSVDLERRYRAERRERGMGPVGDEGRI